MCSCTVTTQPPGPMADERRGITFNSSAVRATFGSRGVPINDGRNGKDHVGEYRDLLLGAQAIKRQLAKQARPIRRLHFEDGLAVRRGGEIPAISTRSSLE